MTVISLKLPNVQMFLLHLAKMVDAPGEFLQVRSFRKFFTNDRLNFLQDTFRLRLGYLLLKDVLDDILNSGWVTRDVLNSLIEESGIDSLSKSINSWVRSLTFIQFDTTFTSFKIYYYIVFGCVTRCRSYRHIFHPKDCFSVVCILTKFPIDPWFFSSVEELRENIWWRKKIIMTRGEFILGEIKI